MHEQGKPGTTYFIRPGWITDSEDGGTGYYAAVDVATGRTIHEHDDVSALVQHMTATHPQMAMIENAYTTGCLRSVPESERL
jgi:hypothetical protein